MQHCAGMNQPHASLARDQYGSSTQDFEPWYEVYIFQGLFYKYSTCYCSYEKKIGSCEIKKNQIYDRMDGCKVYYILLLTSILSTMVFNFPHPSLYNIFLTMLVSTIYYTIYLLLDCQYALN